MGMEGDEAMPWKEMNAMSLRKEFVLLAKQAGSNRRELCRHYGISSRTAYKWLKRYEQEGEIGLKDRSKRPKHIHKRTEEKMEIKVLEMREQTGWGGRKIARVLQDQGYVDVPHPNTITDILRRAGKLEEEECAKHRPVQRFERSQANELWQMDFKGHFAMVAGRCHPLTVLDDHSRFCLGLKACANETGSTVKGHLLAIFRQYGLPQAILCDNGGPWGTGYPDLELSTLAAWLIRLGVHPQHGRPSHPQTQGKEERFHRTLKTELLQGHSFMDLEDCQRHFDTWRDLYNLVRPHAALQLDTPVQHYQHSQRTFPETLPPLEYELDALVRKVQTNGKVTYHDREYRTCKGLVGEYVELRPTNKDGIFDVYYSTYKVRQIDTSRVKS
jgi:transposase InsO family protein